MDDQSGTLPHMVFWSRSDGRLRIIRHCDNVFSLQLDGEDIMPSGNFRILCNYAWAEFDII